MRAVLLTFLLAAPLAAQHGQLYTGPPTTMETLRVHWAREADFDGSILFCRGFYNLNRLEDNGVGWWTDYPGADQNFLVRLADLTVIRVRFDQDGRIPFYRVVSLDDPLLFKCPVVFMSDVGVIALTKPEIAGLASYLAHGGFVWVDDFWGPEAWHQWETELRQALPSAQYPMIDIPESHPINRMMYNIWPIQQQPNIGLWTSTKETSERGVLSEDVHFQGVTDTHGRLIVVMTHNTDIADGWEEEKPENQAYIREFSARSYAIGVNIFLYALTH